MTLYLPVGDNDVIKRLEEEPEACVYASENDEHPLELANLNFSAPEIIFCFAS